jgi:hypothetical protein
MGLPGAACQVASSSSDGPMMKRRSSDWAGPMSRRQTGTPASHRGWAIEMFLPALTVLKSGELAWNQFKQQIKTGPPDSGYPCMESATPPRSGQSLDHTRGSGWQSRGRCQMPRAPWRYAKLLLSGSRMSGLITMQLTRSQVARIDRVCQAHAVACPESPRYFTLSLMRLITTIMNLAAKA